MSAPLSEAARPRLLPGVRLREDTAGGGFVLLAPERVLQANATAVEMLRLCDGERTLGEVINALAQRFAGDRARITADAEALLRDLSSKRMVEL